MEYRTEYSNIPQSIESKLGIELHNQKNHPIEIIKTHIYKFFDSLEYNFKKFDNLSPFVSVEDNFDKLLIPKTHPSRNKSDTYYVNEDLILRSQTSAHQNELLKKNSAFLVSGDVYRKDEIDKYHYPIFHQMEIVWKAKSNDCQKELIDVLSKLVEYLFPKCEYRVNKDYFPFTEPSFEIEVMYNNEWLEILGCGIMHKQILENNGIDSNKIKYAAAGLGLDRLAMKLFEIPDIRLLWSTHEKFINQFKDGKIIKFRPFTKLPSQSRDISFWIPSKKIISTFDELKHPIQKWVDENDFFELIRDHCSKIDKKYTDWVENVTLKDEFFHKKSQKHSRMYRLLYSPNDPSLKNPSKFKDIINIIFNNLRKELVNLDIELR